MTEFNLSEIMEKPVKELTNHEFYLRYKNVIKKNNKKNYPKYSMKDYVRKYKSKNLDRVKAKDKAKYIIIPKNKKD